MLNTRPSADEITRLANSYIEINVRKPNRAEAWTVAEEAHLQLLGKWRRGFHSKAGHCYVWALLAGLTVTKQLAEAVRFRDACISGLFGGTFPAFPLYKGAILGLPTRYWGDDTHDAEDAAEIARKEKQDPQGVWTLYRNACLESYELEMVRTFPMSVKTVEPMVSVECLSDALSRVEDPSLQGPKTARPSDADWGLSYSEDTVEDVGTREGSESLPTGEN